ncbi:MAG: hypothetical protein M3R17_15660 [Bacteroidota bacterium]|nr:hypothetical protein [Bacteroidota bacterium]
MKNSTLLLSAGLLFFGYANAQSTLIGDRTSENLKGNVAHLTQKYYEIVKEEGKDTVENPYQNADRNYDVSYTPKGGISNATVYFTGAKVEYNFNFKYDNAGNKIQETWFNEEGNLDSRITRKFSNNGFLMEIKKYDDTTAEYIDKYVYEVDPVGRPLKITHYDGENALIESTTFLYDGYGNAIEEHSFDAKGKELRKTLCSYDSRHLVTAKDIYNGDGSLQSKAKFTYEFRGKLSGEQIFDNNGKLVEKNTYVYNDQGDKTEWTSFDRTGFVAYKYTYSYEYDANGNWVRCKEFKAGVPAFVTVREVKYN